MSASETLLWLLAPALVALWFPVGFLLGDWLQRFPRFQEWVNDGDA